MGRGEVPTPWDQEEIRNDFRRRQRLKDAVNWLFVGMVSVGGLALILLFGTWVAHLFLPDQYHWISADQVDRIQVILFSGTISSLLTLVGKRIVS